MGYDMALFSRAYGDHIRDTLDEWNEESEAAAQSKNMNDPKKKKTSEKQKDSRKDSRGTEKGSKAA
jgi:hypothetical protein